MSNSVALSYVTREDGAILTAWNRKWGGWCLPGGKVEEGEPLVDGLKRELKEETGLTTYKQILVYQDPSAVDATKMCYVFKVGIEGVARPVEINSGVAWMSREYLLKNGGAFAEWMRIMFEEFDKRTCESRAQEGYDRT